MNCERNWWLFRKLWLDRGSSCWSWSMFEWLITDWSIHLSLVLDMSTTVIDLAWSSTNLANRCLGVGIVPASKLKAGGATCGIDGCPMALNCTQAYLFETHDHIYHHLSSLLECGPLSISMNNCRQAWSTINNTPYCINCSFLYSYASTIAEFDDCPLSTINYQHQAWWSTFLH